MPSLVHQSQPPVLHKLQADTQAIGFNMASDPLMGPLLRSLAASKPAGELLELGTGTGLATAWILDGMDQHATLLSTDSDHRVVTVAQRHLSADPRVTFMIDDGATVVERLRQAGKRVDYIFADTWPGKFYLLDETLALLAAGGFYIIDDMLPRANWPEGHGEKVSALITHLYQLPNFKLTQLDWSTGVIIATKTAEQS